ncbi:MAG: hypothetical protein R3257_06920, partial [bacterium]|nr:hypothetical protein [bacterium]
MQLLKNGPWVTEYKILLPTPEVDRLGAKEKLQSRFTHSTIFYRPKPGGPSMRKYPAVLFFF